MNIVIADDIKGWRIFHEENLLDFLDKNSVKICSFSSARETYDFVFACNKKIDLVITDLQMESMEELAGEWLVKNLKTLKATQFAKYIIISSSYNVSYIADRCGADGFLKKTSYNQNPVVLEYLVKELFGENNAFKK